MNNPENLSLADWYRKYMPGGAERFAKIKFQETINSHGVRFEKVIGLFNNDWNDYLQTVYNGKIYEISKDIEPLTSCEWPKPGNNSNHVDPTCLSSEIHNNPIFQKHVAEYTQLIDSFAFIDTMKT